MDHFKFQMLWRAVVQEREFDETSLESVTTARCTLHLGEPTKFAHTHTRTHTFKLHVTVACMSRLCVWVWVLVCGMRKVRIHSNLRIALLSNLGSELCVRNLSECLITHCSIGLHVQWLKTMIPSSLSTKNVRSTVPRGDKAEEPESFLSRAIPVTDAPSALCM